MNKNLKNILMFGSIILVFILSFYFLSSCSSIFTSYKLSSLDLINNVFATRDGENFLLFKNESGEYYNGDEVDEFIYSFDDNFIFVETDGNQTFDLLAISKKELYCYSLNRNFYLLEGIQNEN